MTIQIRNIDVAVERKHQSNGFFKRLLGPFLSLLLAMLIIAVIIIILGKNPFLAFSSMFEGAFGTINSVGETLLKAVPLMLSGLGLTIAYRTGLTSVGAEGQIVMGGLFSGVVCIYLPSLPGIVLIPIAVLAGMLGGAIWSGIAGALKARLGVSEVIITIMLNYVATYFFGYLLDTVLREPPGYYPQSALLPQQGWLGTMFEGTRLNTGILIALVSAVIVYIILWKLPLGYQMRAVGYNQAAARANGIPVERNIVLAMALSGAFAGLAGMVEISGIHHRLMSGFSSGYGFDAMAVALLGKLHPAGVLLASVLFGALRVGANMMQRTVQVPASLVNVLQGLVILFVLMQELLTRFSVQLFSHRSRQNQKEAAEDAVGEEA